MKNEPAFPVVEPPKECNVATGFTKSELASIHLRVTDQGNPDWLNDMILSSQRQEFAKAALTGLTFGRKENVKTFAMEAFAVADAMMEELGK